MPIFTVDQGYNCLNWRRVVVRAKNVAEAVGKANEADAYDDYPTTDVLECTEWRSDGGGGECGPTFTLGVYRGDVEPAHAKPGTRIEPPVCERQLTVENPNVVNALYEVVERIEAFDKACQAAEKTDTGEAWELLYALRDAARKVLP